MPYAQADSWTLTQSVAVSSDTTLTQDGVSGDSVQGVNVINLDGSVGVVVNGEQTMSVGGNDLTLTQDNASNSRQFVNLMSASKIQSGTQSLSGVDALSLIQTNGTNNSVQAINAAVTRGGDPGTQIELLTQSVEVASASFDVTGSNNIQAGNYIDANSVSSTLGDVTQSFVITGAAPAVYNVTGSDNVQAGNYAKVASGQVEQTFSVNSVVVNHSGADGSNNIQAANVIDPS